MKLLVRLAAFCALLCLVRCPSYAQTSGALTPIPHPTFFNSSGAVAALGFLCTTQTGTSTSLLTYQDAALTTANQNPIRLNSVGRAVNGSNEVSIFLQGQKYRFSLYAAGTGNTCNGTTVGALINQADNVYDLALLNSTSFATLIDDKICHASQVTGASPNDASGKINACIALLPAGGGTVDARGLQGVQTLSVSVTIPTNVTVLLGASSYTCNIGSGVLPCLNLTGNGARLIGMGSGNDSAGADPGTSAALGVTSLVCSTCGATVDMIRVAIPSASRISQNTALIYSTLVSGLWINMGGSGRRPLYITSSVYGQFMDLQAYNLTENGFVLEGDLSSPNNVAYAYFNRFDHVVMQPASTDTTGAACYVNALNGEVSRNRFTATRCSGNITTGGGLNSFLIETGSLATQSANHTTIENSYIGNPSCTAGAYGLHFRSSGTYSSQTGGVIEDFNLSDTLIERLFSCASGIGAGATNASNVGSGAGIGSIVFNSVGSGANWATSFDRLNLGQSYMELSGFSNPGSGQNTIRCSGTTFGTNTACLYMDHVMNAGANSDTLNGISLNPGTMANGKTGLTVQGISVNFGAYTAGGGTVTNAYAFSGNAPTFATNNYFIRGLSGLSRLDGNLGLGRDPAGPLDIGQAASGAAAFIGSFTATITSTGAGQTQNGIQVQPTFATAGNNPTTLRGALIDTGSAITGGGTATLGIGLEVKPPATGATTSVAILADGGVQLNPNFAQPSCAAAYRGTFWYIPGAPGTKDQVNVCTKDASDAYAWRVIY